MKILFVIPFLSGGGAEHVVSILANELAKQDCDVHVLLFYRVQDEYELNQLVCIHTLSNSKIEYKKIGLFSKIKLIRHIIKAIKPDIIIPFLTYVGESVNIARLGIKTKVIETIRNNPRYIPASALGRLIRNLSILFAEGCIVQNKVQLFCFPRWIRKKMLILENPVDQRFLNLNASYERNIIQRIISVGRLEKQKNHKMLIKAFSRIASSRPKLELAIFGEGSMHDELIEYVAELHMGNQIHLNGRTAEIERELARSDLFVLTSDFEGMPNALMEAMAIGLPCISTNCPNGPADLIENNINGILIEVENDIQLEETILALLEDTSKLRYLGENAKNSISLKYSAYSRAHILLEYCYKMIKQ